MFGYAWEVILLNRRPEKEDPSEISTVSTNCWVTGSWYGEVDVILATKD